MKLNFKSNIWKMYVFNFLLSLHFVGGVLVPFFLEWGKISFFQIMILQSIFVFSVFILEVPTGVVADYFGRKASLILAALITSIAALVYSSVPIFYVFIIAEVLWATGGALLSGANQAIVYDSLKKIKKEKTSKKIFGRFSSFQMAAVMISAPIGSVIAATIGLRYTMMVMAVPFFIAFVFAFSFVEPTTKKKSESKRYIEILVNGIKYFKNHKILRILAFDSISIWVLVFLLIWIYQPLLRNLNFPLIYFGLVHAGITGGEIVILNSFTRLEKFFGSKKNYILLSALIPGICFIALAFIKYIPLVIPLIIIIASFGLTRNTLLENYMHKYVESSNRATVMSTINMIKRFVGGIAYPAVGLLMGWSLNYTFIIIGILIILFTFISRTEEVHLAD